MINKLSVEIKGSLFTSWSSVSVTRTIDSICGTFDINCFFDYTKVKKGMPFKISDTVKLEMIAIDPSTNRETKHPVMLGYIENVDINCGNGGMTVNISGRDVTADLVDCNFVQEDSTLSWKGLTPYDLTMKLVDGLNHMKYLFDKQHTIQVAVATTKALQQPSDIEAGSAIVTIEKDEVIADKILEIAKNNGYMVITNEMGFLVLQSKSDGRMREKLQLSVGKPQNNNVLAVSHNLDYTQRYSTLVLTGHKENKKSEIADKGASSAIELIRHDPYVGRYRPLVVTSTTNKELDDEMLMRFNLNTASVSTISIKTQGCVNTENELWRVNNLVGVDLKDVSLPVGDMLIKKITFSIGAEGSYTDMELIHEDAYDDMGFTDASKSEVKSKKSESQIKTG